MNINTKQLQIYQKICLIKRSHINHRINSINLLILLVIKAGILIKCNTKQIIMGTLLIMHLSNIILKYISIPSKHRISNQQEEISKRTGPTTLT